LQVEVVAVAGRWALRAGRALAAER
jgi:hypothetical protein